jgi:hypothetical protein
MLQIIETAKSLSFFQRSGSAPKENTFTPKNKAINKGKELKPKNL